MQHYSFIYPNNIAVKSDSIRGALEKYYHRYPNNFYVANKNSTNYVYYVTKKNGGLIIKLVTKTNSFSLKGGGAESNDFISTMIHTKYPVIFVTLPRSLTNYLNSPLFHSLLRNTITNEFSFDRHKLNNHDIIILTDPPQKDNLTEINLQILIIGCSLQSIKDNFKLLGESIKDLLTEKTSAKINIKEDIAYHEVPVIDIYDDLRQKNYASLAQINQYIKLMLHPPLTSIQLK